MGAARGSAPDPVGHQSRMAQAIDHGSAPKLQSRGWHCIDFAHRYLLNVDTGEPLRLRPWQCELILEIYRLREEMQEGHDELLRLYNAAIIGAGKNIGKSGVLAPAISLFDMLEMGYFYPRIGVAAFSSDQAKLIYDPVCTSIKHSGYLTNILHPKAHEITFRDEKRSGFIRRLHSDIKTLEGHAWHLVICDELGEWEGEKGEKLFNGLLRGAGKLRPFSLLLALMNAGHDRESIGFREFYRCYRGQQPENYLFKWFGEDPLMEEGTTAGDAYRDRKFWKIANPLLGDVLPYEPLELELKTKRENEFRRYYMAQWTKSLEAWLDPGEWEALEDPKLAEARDFDPLAPLDPRKPLLVGIDMSWTADATAVIAAQERPAVRDEEGKVIEPTGLNFIPKIWENPHPVKSQAFKKYRVPQAEIRDYLLALRERFPETAIRVDGIWMDGPAFWYDPYMLEIIAQELEEYQDPARPDVDLECNMRPMPQWDSSMIPATAAFSELIKSGRIRHNGDPAMARHMNRAQLHLRARGMRISRDHAAVDEDGRRICIDGAIGGAMASLGAVRAEILRLQGDEDDIEGDDEFDDDGDNDDMDDLFVDF